VKVQQLEMSIFGKTRSDGVRCKKSGKEERSVGSYRRLPGTLLRRTPFWRHQATLWSCRSWLVAQKSISWMRFCKS